MTEVPLDDRPHTLYRFFAADGRLLYIGITAALPTRLASHNDEKPWWTEIASSTYEHFLNRESVLAAERQAIRDEKPLYNVQHNREPIEVQCTRERVKRKPIERKPVTTSLQKETFSLPDDLPPQHTVALVEDEGRPLSVALRWEVVDGQPVCVGMAMGTATIPDADFHQSEGLPDIGFPIEAGTFRRFPLREHIAEQRVVLMGQLEGEVIVRESAVRVRVKTAARLEEAAAVYRDAFARKERPTKAVAEHFGITSGGASNLVVRARAIGLLPPTSPGAPQG